MHILITGAAGMVGRKLTERLVADGALERQADRQAHAGRRRGAGEPAGFGGKIDAYAYDVLARGCRPQAGRDRPDVIFHLAAVVSGEAETDFEKGYRINLVGMHYLFEAIRCAGGYHPKLVFTSSIAVFGAPFPTRSTTSSTTRR